MNKFWKARSSRLSRHQAASQGCCHDAKDGDEVLGQKRSFFSPKKCLRVRQKQDHSGRIAVLTER